MIQVQLVHPDAKLPTKGSVDSAGYDLSSVEDDVVINPGQRMLIDTGIRVSLPEETYGRIAPRSGLAFKYGIDVLAGVVDRDYRGNIKVILQNHGDKAFVVKSGDRVAQFIVTKIDSASPMIQVDDIEETARGEGGFGSTGV